MIREQKRYNNLLEMINFNWQVLNNPMKETQYHKQGDLYYCPKCDHVLTVREGRIIDSSCKHPYLNYIPVSKEEFIKMIIERPEVLREGYRP